MKFFKKIILPLVAGACALAALAAFAACDDGESNPDDNLTDKQYAVYVYLDDGTTPVEGVSFQLCYNTTDGSSTCASGVYKTDASGRVLFDMTSISYTDNPVIHIVYTYDLTTPDANGNYTNKVYSSLPDGYGLPSNGTTQYLNNNASYEDAWALSERVTTLTLTKA